MLVRRERSGDERAIRRVHAAAFRRATAERDSPPDVSPVDNLRASRDWLAKLSLVAMDGGEVIGHVLCTRARLARGRCWRWHRSVCSPSTRAPGSGAR